MLCGRRDVDGRSEIGNHVRQCVDTVGSIEWSRVSGHLLTAATRQLIRTCVTRRLDQSPFKTVALTRSAISGRLDPGHRYLMQKCFTRINNNNNDDDDDDDDDDMMIIIS